MRDYADLLPKVLAALYPQNEEREQAKAILNQYGVQPFHQERERVQLGILRLAESSLDRLKLFSDLVCTDFRDLLCSAEYPLTSRRRDRSQDTDEYRNMQLREQEEYDAWIAKVLLKQ